MLQCPNCRSVFVEVQGDYYRCENCGWLKYDTDRGEYTPGEPLQTEPEPDIIPEPEPQPEPQPEPEQKSERVIDLLLFKVKL